MKKAHKVHVQAGLSSPSCWLDGSLDLHYQQAAALVETIPCIVSLGSSFSCMMQPTENVLNSRKLTNHIVPVASLAKYCHAWDERNLRQARLSGVLEPFGLSLTAASVSKSPEHNLVKIFRIRKRNTMIGCHDQSFQQAARRILSYSSISQPRSSPLQLNFANPVNDGLLLAQPSLVPELFLSRSIYR